MIFSLKKSTVSVLILCTLCLMLLLIRVFLTGKYMGLFLVWNLFLACTPLLFILIARKYYEIWGNENHLNKVILLSLMLVWLLFFPNSPYIITDLMHLGHLPKNLLWFDSIGIFVTALTGLSIGFYSMYVFQSLAKVFFGKPIAWFLTLCSLFLSAFGLYLGRFIRFNSWDAFLNPVWVLKKSILELNSPLAYQTTSVFSLVLIGLYLAFYNLFGNKNENFKNG